VTSGHGPRLGVEIDLDMLASVLDGDPNTSDGGYLDLTTGDTWPGSVFEDGGFDEDPKDDPERWHYVPCQGSREGSSDMSDFIDDEVDDAVAQIRLRDAITGRGAFRRFATILHDYPDVRIAWFAYRDSHAHARARQWLIDEGLLAEPPVTPGD
jgi:hypothetical protein